MSDGYVYMDTDGTLRYVDVTPQMMYVPFGGTVTLTTNATPPVPDTPALSWGQIFGDRGHEAAGPQATDAKSTSDAMCDVLQGWATALCNESRGRIMTDAISALHRQHASNGRPVRYIPEF